MNPAGAITIIGVLGTGIVALAVALIQSNRETDRVARLLADAQRQHERDRQDWRKIERDLWTKAHGWKARARQPDHDVEVMGWKITTPPSVDPEWLTAAEGWRASADGEHVRFVRSYGSWPGADLLTEGRTYPAAWVEPLYADPLDGLERRHGAAS